MTSHFCASGGFYRGSTEIYHLIGGQISRLKRKQLPLRLVATAISGLVMIPPLCLMSTT